jgi:hypothetical protein
MISVAQHTKQIIEQSPFIEEALYEGLLNVSSLARKIKPEIERRCHKSISEASIVMAINRMTIDSKYQMIKSLNNYLKEMGDITIRDKISVFTYTNSNTLSRLQSMLMEKVEIKPQAVCTFSQGISERTIIINQFLLEDLQQIMHDEHLISRKNHLSAITIKLPQNNTEYAGVYYFILKQLAWKNISIVEVVSTTNEFTMVVHQKDIHDCFKTLLDLKNPQ